MAYLATHDRDSARRLFCPHVRHGNPTARKHTYWPADLMSQEKYVDDSEAMILEALKKSPICR